MGSTYDSGSEDFVSRYKAVTRMDSSATQECNGPIQQGGFGGIITESGYDVYLVELTQW